MKKYLTDLGESSDRFWRITVKKNSLTITQGKVGTMGRTSVRTFPNERDCLCESERLIHNKLRRGYVESHELFPGRPALPALAGEVATRKRIVKVRGGQFTFLPLHEIALISVLVADNTNGHAGVYCAVAYMVAGYDTTPEGLKKKLVWLPCLERFAIWYPCRRDLRLFPEVSWRDIKEKCIEYSNFLEKTSHTTTRDFEAVKAHFSFIPDGLLCRVESLLLLPEGERQVEVDKFFGAYEQSLRRLPFCAELADAHKALVILYYSAGRQYERDSGFDKAIEWFELSLPIINQSHYLRSELFRDIFLQLGFCYQQINKFDNAVRYLDIYRSYDASAWDACDQIKASISNMQQLHKETLGQYLTKVEQRELDSDCEDAEILRREIELVPNDPLFHFNLACLYSVANRENEALYHLEEAFKKGFRNREKILNDRDLKNIRKAKEFEDIRLKYLLGPG